MTAATVSVIQRIWFGVSAWWQGRCSKWVRKSIAGAQLDTAMSSQRQSGTPSRLSW